MSAGNESAIFFTQALSMLVGKPAAAMEAVCALTGIAPRGHDCETVFFETREFDTRLGTPGLHDVRPRVAASERKTILPLDLWERWERAGIWRMPESDTLDIPIADEGNAKAPGS